MDITPFLFSQEAEIMSPEVLGAYCRLLWKIRDSGEGVFTLPQLTRVFGATGEGETREILGALIVSEALKYVHRDQQHYFTHKGIRKRLRLSASRSAAGKLGAAKTNSRLNE